MEVKEFGYIEKGTGQHQSNTIYDSNYLCPTLSACDYKEPLKVYIDSNERKNIVKEDEVSMRDDMKPVKLLELFGGIGACSKAFEKAGIPYEIVDYVEIDKYAVKSFNAIHNTNFEPQDICEWDKDIDVDFIMHGSPCQDFSLAGKQAGGDEGSGTRSSLMYETLRIVGKLKPKYVVWENVRNLVSQKHIKNFNNYIMRMSQLGYTSSCQVLDAQDYGVPQHRERVFTVSIRNDLNTKYQFPPKQKLTKKLKDLLEENVDESYYLSDRALNGVLNTNFTQSKLESRIENENGVMHTIAARDYKDPKLVIEDKINVVGNYMPSGHNAGRVISTDGVTPTVMENHGTVTAILEEDKLPINNNTSTGYLFAEEGDGVDISGRMKYHRGTVQKEKTQTLTTSCDVGVVVREAVDKVGNIYPSGGQNGNVYNPNGISPTIMSGETSNPKNGGIGSNNAPKILVSE